VASKALALFLLCAGAAHGCGRPSSDDGPRPVVLRVGSSGVMGRFVPAPTMEGAAAAAIELTHEYVHAHAVIRKRSAVELVLSPKPTSALTAEQLAATVQFEGISGIDVETANTVRIRFHDAAHCAAFEQWGMLDIGPFRIENPNARPIRLLRRAEAAIDVIEIRDVTTEEQWRLLHGRHLDVIPVAGDLALDKLEGLASIRTVGIATRSALSLYFNLDNPSVASADTRRAIVRVLDRRAIAAAVCGSPRCDLGAADPPAPANAELPPRLTLTAGPGNERAQRAVEAVRHQLRAAGIDVELRQVDTTDRPQLFDSPSTALTISPWNRTPDSYGWFTSPSTGGPALTGYANPDFDRAVADGDVETAQRLLENDVPVAPLLQLRLFSVIDNQFCGDVTPLPTSWRWLADLRPCAPGESP